jgi:hypothetical protein
MSGTRLIKGLLAAAVLAVISGCSSYGSARIQSEPSGAEVINMSDDAVVGTTPFLLTRKSDREESRRISVRLRKPGYQDDVKTFWLHLHHSSRINAEYTPQEINVELIPVQPAGTAE